MNAPSFISSLKSPTTRRARRFRWIALALLVYTIIGFFVVPALIKSQLLKRLPGITHRQASVAQVKMNPYVLSLTIRGLSLTETNGERFAGFDEFYVNFQLSSLFRLAWTFSEIRLAHPTANIARGADGQFNFGNLLASGPASPPDTTKKPKSLPVVLVHHLVVTNGDFNFTDQTRATPLHIDYGPINLDLKNFTTRRNKDGLYSLAVSTRVGGDFAWSGTLSANPPQSAGKFRLHNVVLKTYSPYIADFAHLEITDGVLEVGAEYRINAGVSPLELDVTNATVKLANFQLKAPDTGEMLLALNDVAVTHASGSFAAREARVPLVAVRGGSLLARRERDGQLNWLKLLVTQTNAMAASVSSESNSSSNTAAPWKAFLDEFNLEGFAITAEDQAPATTAQLGLDDLRIHLKGVSNQTNSPLAANVEFNWRGGGTVRVEAKGTVLPPAGEAKLAVTHLALPPLQPYVEQQARLVLNTGDLTVNGQARYDGGGSNAPVAQFTGDVSIAKFGSIDTVAYHDFAKWDDLNLRGIQLTLQANALKVEEVKFSGLETSVVVSSNGLLNVQGWLKEKPSAVSSNATVATAAPEPSPAAAAFPVKVAALVFEKCSFRAADQSITPRFDTTIEEFSGAVRDLTLPGLTRARVDIRGKVSALAPFRVTGTITPDAKNPFVDLKLTMTNDDLTPFTPYTEKFAGHSLNKGKLTFDLSYKIENRKLEATNIIALDHFTFGPRNQSTNATKLPVKLGVALLKDRNGRIDLNLPISGSLDDPKFSIRALVWKAISNILLKVAASPFSLLGGIVGGGGEELQYVDFTPGSATPDPGQTNKLNTLAKALYERPALGLEISASVDSADREMVSRQKLQDKMKSRRVQELTARGKPVPALSEFKLEPGDYERLLRATYKESFNIEPESALRQAREAAALTNSPAASAATLSGTRPPTDTIKGAARLLQPSQSSQAANVPLPNASASASAAPAKRKTEHESVLEEMERRLMMTAPASDDDLRELMQKRCLSVEKLLLDTGKVTAEQVLLVSPKPVDPAVKGMARATFSLN